jgi:hypothetical protein
MTVHTVDSLRRSARRLDRQAKRRAQRITRKEHVIDAMRRGSALHQQHVRGRRYPIWTLSDETEIPHEVAIAVIADRHVISLGDGLFGAKTSQTFRLVK